MPIGDLIREGKSLEVHCRSCQLAHRLYVETGSLDLPKRLPLQEVANLLVCLGQQGCYAKRVMKHAHGTIHAAERPESVCAASGPAPKARHTRFRDAVSPRTLKRHRKTKGRPKLSPPGTTAAEEGGEPP